MTAQPVLEDQALEVNPDTIPHDLVLRVVEQDRDFWKERAEAAKGRERAALRAYHREVKRAETAEAERDALAQANIALGRTVAHKRNPTRDELAHVLAHHTPMWCVGHWRRPCKHGWLQDHSVCSCGSMPTFDVPRTPLHQADALLEHFGRCTDGD